MARNLIVFIVLLLAATVYLPAQGCGPGCPVCSGSGQSTGSLLKPGSFVLTSLAIPDSEEETNVFNIRGGVNSWLDLGLGYAMESEKLLWSVRFQPLSEDEESWRPSIIVGTGSVQTGGSDQSAFVQLTKSYEFSEAFSARLSVGAATLFPDFDKEYILAGLTMTVTERWSPFINYDGLNYHVGLSWIPFDWLFVTGLLLEMENPSILVGFRWGLSSDGNSGE